MTKDQILKALSHRLTRLRSRLLDGADAFAGKVSALPPAVEVGSETGIGTVTLIRPDKLQFLRR
jgi:hypothetical protein